MLRVKILFFGIFGGVERLDHGGVGVVHSCVADKGNQNNQTVQCGDHVDSRLAQLRHQNQNDEAEEQYSGADLAGDQRASEHLTLTQGHQSGDHLETFFDKE